MKQVTTAKIVPLAVALAADAGAGVTGQVFAVRNDGILRMSQQPRPLRSVHRGEGRTPETVAQRAAGAEGFFLRARPFARRVHLGPGLMNSARDEPTQQA